MLTHSSFFYFFLVEISDILNHKYIRYSLQRFHLYIINVEVEKLSRKDML